MKIFRNYGCLGAEKRCVYTYGNPHHTADAWDEIEVAIPQGWEENTNKLGEITLISPWGWPYKVNEVLSGNKVPCFAGCDKKGNAFRYNLEEI